MKFKLKKLSVLLAVVGGLTLSAASMLGSNSSVFANDVAVVKEYAPAAERWAKEELSLVYSYLNDELRPVKAGLEYARTNVLSYLKRQLAKINSKFTDYFVQNDFNRKDSENQLEVYNRLIYNPLKDLGFTDSETDSGRHNNSARLYEIGKNNGVVNDNGEVAGLVDEVAGLIGDLMNRKDYLNQGINMRRDNDTNENVTTIVVEEVGNDNNDNNDSVVVNNNVAVESKSESVVPSGNVEKNKAESVVVNENVERGSANQARQVVEVQKLDAAGNPFADIDVEGVKNPADVGAANAGDPFAGMSVAGLTKDNAKLAKGNAVNPFDEDDATLDDLDRYSESGYFSDDEQDDEVEVEEEEADDNDDVKNIDIADIVKSLGDAELRQKFLEYSFEYAANFYRKTGNLIDRYARQVGCALGLSTAKVYQELIDELEGLGKSDDASIERGVIILDKLRDVLKAFMIKFGKKFDKVKKEYMPYARTVKKYKKSIEKASTKLNIKKLRSDLGRFENEPKNINLVFKYKMMESLINFMSDEVMYHVYDAKNKENLGIGKDKNYENGVLFDMNLNLNKLAKGKLSSEESKAALKKLAKAINSIGKKFKEFSAKAREVKKFYSKKKIRAERSIKKSAAKKQKRLKQERVARLRSKREKKIFARG